MFPKYIQHAAAVLLLYLFSTEKSFPYFLSLHLFFFASVTWIIQFSPLLPLPFLPLPFLPLISSDTLLFLFPLPHPFHLLLVLPSFPLHSTFLSFPSFPFYIPPPFLFIHLSLFFSYFPFPSLSFPFPPFPSLRLYRHWPSSRVRVRGREERVLVLFSLTAYSQGICLLFFFPVHFHARLHLCSFLYTPIFFSAHTH